MGFVGTKPTISSNVVIANAGTIGSASDEDAIAIAADGSVTFTQDIELGHASDTTIARASSGQITVEGTAVLLAGAQTGITTILNASTKIGRSAANLIDFATTDNKLIFRVEGVNEVELVQNALSPVTSDGVALGTGSLMWSDIFLASASVINFNNGDVSITHTANLLTITGGGLVVGVNDTGHDVKFFGASAGAYMEWDESADQLRIMGAEADATTSTGKLLLATSLTDINANDVIGKVEFQAPHEAGGTDAITVAAAIEAVAQGTFSASVNATDILFKTGHSEAATEKFRFTSQGEIGIGGTNYGTDGQILTSGGAGAATAWEDAPAGGVSFTATAEGAISAGDLVSINSAGDVEKAQGIQAGITWTGFYPAAGTAVITHASVYYASMGFDPDNNKFMVSYRDGSNSNYPTMAMGHINDAVAHTVAFGTPVVLKSATTYQMGMNKIPYDTNVDRFVVGYTGNDNNIFVKICAVNDAASNTITAGSEQTVEAASDQPFGMVFDSNANRIIMIFQDEGNSNITSAAAFTVRGSSDNDIQTLGTTLDVTGADDIDGKILGLCFDSNDNKVMYVYGDASNSTRATAVALTVSTGDNSITKGTAVVLDTITLNAGYEGALVHHPERNINLFVTRNSGGTNLLYMPFTSASGSITAGTMFTETDIAALGQEVGGYLTADYNPDFERIVVFNTYSGMRVQVGDISGTGASATYVIDDTIAYIPKNGETNGGYSSYIASAYDTNSNKHAIFFYAQTGTAGLYANLPKVPYNAGNFIGIANSAISDDATGTITSGGTGTNQSSLTVGSQYYLDSGGTLTTTSGGTPVGKALSATTILVNAPVKQ